MSNFIVDLQTNPGSPTLEPSLAVRSHGKTAEAHESRRLDHATIIATTQYQRQHVYMLLVALNKQTCYAFVRKQARVCDSQSHSGTCVETAQLESRQERRGEVMLILPGETIE